MTRITILKTVKASTDNSNGKPLPVDKTLGINPDILLHEIEHIDNTEEG